MRDIKTLLQIVIDSLKETKEKQSYGYGRGICSEALGLAYDGFINENERILIDKYIRQNNPFFNKRFSRFTKTPYFLQLSPFYWSRMDKHPETRQIRIDYLTQLKDSL